MIKFRQKDFTLQEGHYTGPKDIDKIPGAVEIIGKSALGGAGIGAVAGTILKDSTLLEGATTGAKWGTLGGIVAKLFINYLHKPMTTIKYQEVDKAIRRQFGIYQLAGITVGDTISKRSNIDDKFSFNDRNVSSYKLNFAIHNNQVTMYTFGLTKEDLDKVNKSIDYYCKKFYSMEYTAKIINQKVNSYSVDFTFTNYQVICQLIIELANSLGTKINLLDNSAIVDKRLSEATMAEEKEFSVSEISKYDLMKILGTGLSKGLGSFLKNGKGMISSAIHHTILEGVIKLNENDLTSLGVLKGRGEYNNKFLESELKKLHYIDGFDYSTGSEDSDVNISLISGILLITTTKDKCKDIDDNVWKSLKTKIHRSDTGKVIVYTYALKGIKELEMILVKLLNIKCKPNIYDKPASTRLFSGNNKMVEKIKEKLDSDGIIDYEISDKVQSDVISFDPSASGIKIYIPRDLEYAQYKIDDEIRDMAKFVRTQVTMDRNIYVMKLNGSLTPAQIIKLIKFIIDEEGFCTILDI